MSAELNSAVRSRTSTRVCWSDFWRSGRGPPRVCRYRGRKTARQTSRRRRFDWVRSSTRDSRRLGGLMKRLPPPGRSALPSYDTWRFRVDDGPWATAASRTIHSLTSFAFGERRAPAGSFTLVARLRLASCEAPPFEIERATLRGSACGHVRYILENSKAVLRLGHDWKVETTLRTWFGAWIL